MDNTPVRGASYKHHGQRLECVLSLGIQVLVNKMQDTQEHIAVIFKTLSSSIRAPTLTETNGNRAWFQYSHIVEQGTLGSSLTGLRISASLPPKTFIATLRKRSRSRRQKAS